MSEEIKDNMIESHKIIHQELFGDYKYKADLHLFFNAILNKKDTTNKLHYIRESVSIIAMPWKKLKPHIQSPPLYRYFDNDIGIQKINKSVMNKEPDEIYGLKYNGNDDGITTKKVYYI